MVCDDCQNKIGKLVTPDVKFGSKSNSNVKVNVNMILSKKKDSLNALGIKCLICRTRVESKNKYCLTCAFSKGLCEMCGKKISETKMYRNTDVDWKDNKRKNEMIEKTKSLSNKLLIEKNIIKNEDKSLKKKRNRTEEKPQEITQKNKREDSHEMKSINETHEEEGKEKENDINYNQDEYEYDEIIKL